MDRTLSDYAAAADIVGTIAVIITLIFVGVQIRQNTKATKAAAAQAVHSNFAAWYASLQGEPDILAMSLKGMVDYSAISPLEKAQFFAMFMAFNAHMQDAYYKMEDGSLEPELWNCWERLAATFYSTPGGKAFWEERGYMFGRRFQNYLNDDLMQRPLHPKAKPWGNEVRRGVGDVPAVTDKE